MVGGGTGVGGGAGVGGGGSACVPETSAALCTRLGAEFGTATGADNCNKTRTVTCAMCAAPKSCGATGTANKCSCAAETDAQFCAGKSKSKSCGSAVGFDNCGVSRTVANCGTCTSPKVCTGANQCYCAPETDAAFCTRVGTNCGSVTDYDSCDVSRTVASCGSCNGYQTCGPANVCGGHTEALTPVCGGGFCWANPLPTGSDLTATRTAPSGNSWVAGDNGTVLKWDGAAWHGWLALADVRLNTLWPFSDTDVWAAGVGGAVIHYDGTSWTPVASGTTQDLRGMWGAPDGTRKWRRDGSLGGLDPGRDALHRLELGRLERGDRVDHRRDQQPQRDDLGGRRQVLPLRRGGLGVEIPDVLHGWLSMFRAALRS